ncbi:hypothetical protein QQ045_003823 [Rhodiola kirilowii]
MQPNSACFFRAHSMSPPESHSQPLTLAKQNKNRPSWPRDSCLKDLTPMLSSIHQSEGQTHKHLLRSLYSSYNTTPLHQYAPLKYISTYIDEPAQQNASI